MNFLLRIWCRIRNKSLFCADLHREFVEAIDKNGQLAEEIVTKVEYNETIIDKVDQFSRRIKGDLT